MTGMSKQTVTDSTGSTKDSGTVHQTSAASKDRSRESIELTLEEVLHRDNLISAYHRVVSNKGAAGTDGMTVDALGDYLRQDWSNLRTLLLLGRYYPSAIRVVEIPKPSSGMRVPGIPTVIDRFPQQALLQKRQPIYDPEFSERSIGFRPDRSAQQAVVAIGRHERWHGKPTN